MTNEANIDINIDDSAIDQLTRSLDALTRALNDTAGEFNQAERNADDLEKDLKDLKEQSDRTERSMAALGGATAGIAAGVVAIAGAIELAKISVEAFAETNETAAARLDILRGAGQELLGEFGRIILGGDQFEQTLEALTLIAEELTGFVNDNSEALSELARGGLRLAIRAFFGLADGVLAVIQFYENLDENMGLLQASFLDLKVGVLEFAQDAERSIANFIASAIENFADLIDASDNVFEAIVDNPAFRAVFGFEEGEFEGPATFVANALRDMAQTIRGGEFDRFQDSIDNAALAAQELRFAAEATVSKTGQLREDLRESRDNSLDLVNNLESLTARPIEVEVEVRGAGGGAAGAAQSEEERIRQLFEASREMSDRLNAANAAIDELERIYLGSKLFSKDLMAGSIEGIFSFADAFDEVFNIMNDQLEGLADENALEEYVLNIAGAIQDVEEIFAAEARLMQKHQENIFDVPFMDIHKEFSRQLRQTADNYSTIIGFAEALGASEERIAGIEERRDAILSRIERQYRTSIDLAAAEAEARKQGLPLDTSGLILEGGGPAFRDLLAVDPVISDLDELRAAFDALPDRIRNVAVEANMSFTDILKSINNTNAALREAFSDAAFKGIENTFISLGQSIGDAFGTGLDEGESAGERAKKIAGKIFGQFLQVIGSTAIAQGLIIAIGDPSIGGFPNPGRGAALIAAGTAAIATGAAISGKASKGKGSKGGSATTTGGGGGARNASTTTQIFIENQFGNRFDARELDRAAAQSFSRAAAAGQA
jgi:hypothetical protein